VTGGTADTQCILAGVCKILSSGKSTCDPSRFPYCYPFSKKVFSKRLPYAICFERRFQQLRICSMCRQLKAEKAHLIQLTLPLPNNSKSTAYQDTSTDPDLRPKLLASTFIVVRNVTSLVPTSDWFLVNLVIMSSACIGTSIGTWTNEKDLLHGVTRCAASVSHMHAQAEVDWRGSDSRHMQTHRHLNK